MSRAGVAFTPETTATGLSMVVRLPRVGAISASTSQMYSRTVVRPSLLPDIVKPELDIRRLPTNPDGPARVLSVPAKLRRTGLETKLLIQGASDPAHRHADRSLLRLIAMARRFNELVTTGAGLTVTELAIQAGVSRSYFSRIFRLSLLAPEITKAIVQGRQPSELSAIKLMGAGRFACVWSDQLRQLGFD